MKACGYREGKYTNTYVHWNRRRLKRAALPPFEGESQLGKRSPRLFYANCVWGTFKGAKHPYEMDVAFPNVTCPGGVDFEIDGYLYHNEANRERDAERDAVLRANDWVVVRIPTERLYHVFVPLLNRLNRGSGG
jgi:hypothetical protein